MLVRKIYQALRNEIGPYRKHSKGCEARITDRGLDSWVEQIRKVIFIPLADDGGIQSKNNNVEHQLHSAAPEHPRWKSVLDYGLGKRGE